MAYLTVEFWEILLDILGCCLCCITVLFIAGNRMDGKPPDIIREVSGATSKDFNKEVFFHLFKQQSERAFGVISEAIRSEFEALFDSIKRPEIDKGLNRLSGRAIECGSGCSREKVMGVGVAPSSEDRYDEVVRLADYGLSAGEISERLLMSEGEIHLVMKLRKIRPWRAYDQPSKQGCDRIGEAGSAAS